MITVVRVLLLSVSVKRKIGVCCVLVSRLSDLLQVFAIDTLGCGLSSRPPWDLGDGADCDVDAAESFFIEGMEQWRVASGIEKMVRPACDGQCCLGHLPVVLRQTGRG